VTIAPPAVVRRIAYLGSPGLAVPPLRALHEAGFEIPLVVTRVDKRRGRGGATQPTPVKAAAVELGLPVSHSLDDALRVDADLGVVVAYGRIIPASVLDRLAMVNIHFSLLPRWRGAAPVERALLAGDTHTGVCLMAVDEALDTGDVYRRAETPIADDDTLATLRTRLVEMGTTQLVEALREGLGEPEPQVGEPVYAEKITADELAIDWHDRAVAIDRLVRLGDAWTTFRDRRLKIHEIGPSGGPALPPAEVVADAGGVTVGVGDGAVELRTVQPEGKPRIDAAAWANGARLEPGERLGPS
jgi:methionyl-tRNA formyltransferase